MEDLDPVNDRARLRVGMQGDAMVIAAQGVLDEAAVGTIGSAAACALNCQCRRVRVDLRNVTGHTEGGAQAFADLLARLPASAAGRVTYHANSEAAQNVLVAAYARLD